MRARTAIVVAVLLGLVLVLPGQAAPTLRRDAAGNPSDNPPVDPAGAVGAAGGAAGGMSSPAALRLLRRAADAADKISYTGTQVVVAWHDGGSTSRLVDVSQTTGGPRTASVQDTVGGTDVAGMPAGVGLSVLADRQLTARTLAALTSCYAVALGGRGRIAGRPATIVVASRGGHRAARMWLDDDTGLMLRQDVLATDGKLRRTAAFLDVNTGGTGGPTGAPTAKAGGATATATAGWTEIPLTEAGGWRAQGWPVLPALDDGFQLLDARRGTLPGGGDALHLTYGDGLSAISVFLQRGRLDTSGLAGWDEQTWGDTSVRVRSGWPEMITWQGGGTVITALGDVGSGDLEDALMPLPRDAAPGTMDNLARFARNAFGWLPG